MTIFTTRKEPIKLVDLVEQMGKSLDGGNHWEMIRRFYKNYESSNQKILARTINNLMIKTLCLAEPSHIEKNAIEDIEEYNANFYFQYPIGKYFADFCDPENMIVIELDGKEFHKDRRFEDAARQSEIEKMGYLVFRFEGAGAYMTVSELLQKHSLSSDLEESSYMPKIKAYADSFCSAFLYYSVYGQDFKDNILRLREFNNFFPNTNP